jgi:hypothetical protein
MLERGPGSVLIHRHHTNGSRDGSLGDPEPCKSAVAARAECRLAAILAADVAGYSRLIEAEEEEALNRLKGGVACGWGGTCLSNNSGIANPSASRTPSIDPDYRLEREVIQKARADSSGERHRAYGRSAMRGRREQGRAPPG